MDILFLGGGAFDPRFMGHIHAGRNLRKSVGESEKRANSEDQRM